MKDWDFLTRAYNAVSPVTLNLEQAKVDSYSLIVATIYVHQHTILTVQNLLTIQKLDLCFRKL